MHRYSELLKCDFGAFVRTKGWFRTEYIVLAPSRDYDLNSDSNLFIDTLTLYDLGKVKLKTARSANYPEYCLMMLTVWNEDNEEAEQAIARFCYKMNFASSGYKNFSDTFWDSIWNKLNNFRKGETIENVGGEPGLVAD